MDKEDVVYIYSGILLSHKKDEILSFVTTWMDLEGIMLSEISQTEKDKYHVISLMCGISKTKQANIKQKQSYRYREQTSDCQREWGKGEERNRQERLRYKLPVAK